MKGGKWVWKSECSKKLVVLKKECVLLPHRKVNWRRQKKKKKYSKNGRRGALSPSRLSGLPSYFFPPAASLRAPEDWVRSLKPDVPVSDDGLRSAALWMREASWDVMGAPWPQPPVCEGLELARVILKMLLLRVLECSWKVFLREFLDGGFGCVGGRKRKEKRKRNASANFCMLTAILR